MRVITSSGFGNFDELQDPHSEYAAVDMEDVCDPLGARQTLPLHEIYPFGSFFVVRIANIQGIGVASNILPFLEEGAARAFYYAPAPGGETRFFLNIRTGQFSMTRSLGYLAGRYLHLEPWLDRWGSELSAEPSDEDSNHDEVAAIKEFDDVTSNTAGTAGGIHVRSLLDIERKIILRFAISVTATRGVVFLKKW